MREHALKALSRGLNIFPCKAGGSTPSAHFGTHVASSEADLAKHRWWASDNSKKNIGVRTGWSENLNAYVIVLDVDVHHNGHLTLQKLCEENEILPDTYAVSTPSGGAHFYFKSDKDLRNRAGTLGVGLDIRGHNGYVVAEGSVREATAKKPAGVYTQAGDTDTIAPMPAWLEKLCVHGVKKDTPTKNTKFEDEEFVEDIPAGERNDRLFREAAGLRGKGANKDAIYAYLKARNDSFTNPLSEKEIQTLASSAASYSVNEKSKFEELSRQVATQMAQKENAKEEAPRKPEKVNSFSGVALGELKAMDLPELRYAVEGFMAEGLYFLTGRPKGGKSWLAMEIAACVSSGRRLWNQFQTVKSPVLYLALEDGYRRLKDRMQYFPEGHKDNLTFVIDKEVRDEDGNVTRPGACNLGEGLEEQLEAHMDMHPDTRLIVIDLLQRVRGEIDTRGTAYQIEYDLVKRVQQIAVKRRFCLLFVHHTRKQETSHVMDSVSGSQGIAGAADGMLFLQSPQDGASGKLTMFSRDTDNGEYEFSREDMPSGRWHCEGRPKPKDDGISEESLKSQIIATLLAQGENMTFSDLHASLPESSSEDRVRRVLRDLVRDGALTRTKLGRQSCFGLVVSRPPERIEPDLDSYFDDDE